MPGRRAAPRLVSCALQLQGASGAPACSGRGMRRGLCARRPDVRTPSYSLRLGGRLLGAVGSWLANGSPSRGSREDAAKHRLQGSDRDCRGARRVAAPCDSVDIRGLRAAMPLRASRLASRQPGPLSPLPSGGATCLVSTMPRQPTGPRSGSLDGSGGRHFGAASVAPWHGRGFEIPFGAGPYAVSSTGGGGFGGHCRCSCALPFVPSARQSVRSAQDDANCATSDFGVGISDRTCPSPCGSGC